MPFIKVEIAGFHDTKWNLSDMGEKLLLLKGLIINSPEIKKRWKILAYISADNVR